MHERLQNMSISFSNHGSYHDENKMLIFRLKLLVEKFRHC